MCSFCPQPILDVLDQRRHLSFDVIDQWWNCIFGAFDDDFIIMWYPWTLGNGILALMSLISGSMLPLVFVFFYHWWNLTFVITDPMGSFDPLDHWRSFIIGAAVLSMPLISIVVLSWWFSSKQISRSTRSTVTTTRTPVSSSPSLWSSTSTCSSSRPAVCCRRWLTFLWTVSSSLRSRRSASTRCSWPSYWSTPTPSTGMQ